MYNPESIPLIIQGFNVSEKMGQWPKAVSGPFYKKYTLTLCSREAFKPHLLIILRITGVDNYSPFPGVYTRVDSPTASLSACPPPLIHRII